MKTRIISILLLVCLLATLCSCGGKEPEVTQTPDTTDVGTDAPSKWEGVSFGGETIVISLNANVPTYAENAGADSSVKYVKGPDDYTTDAVQNTVYDRNKRVANALGLNVVYEECDQYSANKPDNTLTVIESFVLADLEDSPDAVSTMSYGIIRAGIKGLLYNALTDSQKNYFDLSSDGWYTDFMYENTLDESKIFMLAGDYFIDVLRYSYGIMVNLSMYDDVFAAEGGSESLFELVESGEWTYDEMKRAIQMAYVDAGEVGQYDDADTFGAINHASWLVRTTFSTAGLDVFETDENGELKYVSDISEIHNYVDFMIDFTRTDGFYNVITGGPNKSLDSTTVFVEGRTLFAFDAPLLNMEGTLVQNMDDSVGIIPYPKYEADQKYGAMVSDNANVGGVLYNSDKFTECSAYLQMSAEESNNGKGSLIYEYFDVALKYKLSATPEQVTMLEYIRDGLCAPKSLFFDNYFAKSVGLKPYSNLINGSLATGTNTFASDWESQYSAVQGALENTLVSYGQQN